MPGLVLVILKRYISSPISNRFLLAPVQLLPRAPALVPALAPGTFFSIFPTRQWAVPWKS